MSRDPVVGRRKGLQPCSLVIGARDDSFAGDLCCGGLYLRGRGGDPSLRAAGNDYRRRARRLGGGAGGDGDTLGSPVFGPRRQTLARLVSASALPIAVQPQAASARTDDRFGAAAGREADRQKRAAARRRHPDRGRQLPRLREPQRLCRHRRLRLLPVQEPVFVGRAACPCHRPRRLPLGYTLVAANEKEYEPVRELTTAHKGCTLIADKGLWGREYAQTLALQEVTILTPERTRNASNLERERRLAGLRLVIESTISNLKCQMRLERHLAKTPAGLAQRIVQRLLALTIGMLLNTLTGRPPRALVAYDGR